MNRLTNKCKSVLFIIMVSLCWVVDDKRSTEPIDIVALVMAMDPVSAVLFDGDSVGEVCSWRDGTLGDHRGAVHLVVSCLKQTMSVQCCWFADLVHDVDDQRVIQSDINRWWSIRMQ